jgi:hypothetical protein
MTEALTITPADLAWLEMRHPEDAREIVDRLKRTGEIIIEGEQNAT